MRIILIYEKGFYKESIAAAKNDGREVLKSIRVKDLNGIPNNIHEMEKQLGADGTYYYNIKKYKK